MRAKWNRTVSPKDGQTYAIKLRNCIGDQWESTAIADASAKNGWRNGNWQDWAKEVVGWQPIVKEVKHLQLAQV